MKRKSILVVIFALLFVNLISLPTFSKESTEEFQTASKFVRVTTNAVGYNFIAKSIAKKVITRALNKNAKGDYDVYIDSFSGVDLKKGKFRGMKIVGENVSIEDSVFISKMEMKTTSDFNYVKYNKKPIKFMTDIPMEYVMEITDEDLNKMFTSNKFVSALSQGIPLVKIDKIRTTMEPDKLRFSSRIRLPLCKPIKCSVSAGLKVEDGKIIFNDIDTSSLKADMREFVEALMNRANFLTKMNLYIFEDATTVLEIKNVKILENKIVIDGNVTIKRAE